MAAVDYFLKIDGIEGESTDSKHKGEIELLSFSWGAANNAQVASGSGRGGRVTFQDFQFSKLFDKSSPAIFLKCVNGQQITTMTLTARRAGEAQFANPDFMKIVFSNVLISFYKEQEPNTDALTSEEVGALFKKMSLTFTGPPPKGGAADVAPITDSGEARGDGG